MHAYLARRLAYAVLTLFGITIVTFTLIHAVPGDPTIFYLGKAGSRGVAPAVLDAIRREYHLNEPLPVQYGWWMRSVITLDFGRSVVDHRPVIDRIGEKLPNTIVLNTFSLLLAAFLGVPIGLWSASRHGHPAERASSVLFFLLYSLPTFWVGLLLMELFAVHFDWLPLYGMTADDYLELSRGAQLFDRFRHLVLPVTTLTYAQLAFLARFSKSAVAEVIREDFIVTARAKGASAARVLWAHGFRNALLPLVTLFGLTIPSLLSGSLIVETIFQWDGIGRLYYDSMMARDYPTVLALTVVTAVVTLLATILADVLYAVADPRVRIEGRR